MSIAITTPDELDALPTGAVVLTQNMVAWQKEEQKHPYHWRSTKGTPTDARTLLRSSRRGLVVLYVPDSETHEVAEHDARYSILSVLEKQLPFVDIQDNPLVEEYLERVCNVIVGQLTEDGLLNYAPCLGGVPDCGMLVKGPGALGLLDLDVAPSGSVVVTKGSGVWGKHDGFWQWLTEQSYDSSSMLDADFRVEDKTSRELLELGAMTLVIPGQEE